MYHTEREILDSADIHFTVSKQFVKQYEIVEAIEVKLICIPYYLNLSLSSRIYVIGLDY